MQTTILHIDSRDIDLNTYRLGKYRVAVPQLLRNVSRVDLVSVEVPNVLMTIDSTNNKIDFVETTGAVVCAATLTTGNYTRSALLSHLRTVMDAASTINFTITAGADGKVVIVGDAAFSMPFATGANAATSVHSLLGFATTDRASATSHTASDICDVAIHRNVFLHLPSLSYNAISTNRTLQPFAKLPLNGSFGDIIFYSELQGFMQGHRIIQTQNLSYIDVLWTTYNGTEVDFEGVHHGLTLRITHD